MRVLFYGTPGFAIPSLTALVGEGFDVVGVVTQPDKPAGRHRSTVEAPPVKRAALAEDLDVLQPDNPRSDEFLEQVRGLAPDIAVVVGYGHILSEALLQAPARGSINVHASLLPKLRGAAPIERAVLEGHTETGVTIMKMDRGMDTGPILHQLATPIAPEETGGDLRNRLAELGASALIEALTLMDEAGLKPQPQDESLATFAPKLTRQEERLSFAKPAADVARHIRAFDPLPGAWAELRGKPVKLYAFREQRSEIREPAGTVIAAGDTLLIACGDGAVEIAEIQPAGKARMMVRAFVNGRGVAAGDVLA